MATSGVANRSPALAQGWARPVAAMEATALDPMAIPAAPGGAAVVRQAEFEGEFVVAWSHVVKRALPLMEQVFEDSVPGVDLQLRATSARSAAGWVLDGKAEAAVIHGDLTPGERDRGLVAWPVADHVLAVVAHPSIEFSNIEQPYLKQLLTGTINHWSWVGSNAGHVALVLPKPGPLAAFVANEFIPGDALTDKSIRYDTEAEGLIQVASTPGAVGVFSLAATRGMDDVKVLMVDSREPAAPYLRGGHYPFGATVYLVCRGTPTGDTRALHDVMLGRR